MNPLQDKWVSSTGRHNADSCSIYINKLITIFDMGIISK